MSVSDRGETTSVKTNSSSVLLIPIYTASIFLSAALLFAVQPMFTKMVLMRSRNPRPLHGFFVADEHA